MSEQDQLSIKITKAAELANTANGDETKLKQAIELLDEVLLKTPDSSIAHYNKAICLLTFNQTEQALHHINRTIEINQNQDPNALLLRGVLYYKQSKLTEALKDFDFLLKFDPFNFDGLYYRASTLHALERNEEALQTIEIARKQHPFDHSLLSLHSELLQQLNRNEEASKINKLLEENPQQKLETAEQLLASNNSQESLPLLNQLLQYAEDSVRVHFDIAIAKQQMGDLRSAADSYARCIQLAPDHLPSIMSRIQCLRALKQDLQEALELADRLIELAPNQIDSFAIKAVILQDLNRSTEAQEYFTKSIALYPSDPQQLLSVAQQFLRQRRFQEAIVAYSLLIDNEKLPTEQKPVILVSLGSVYALLGSFNEANDFFNKAVDLDPKLKPQIDSIWKSISSATQQQQQQQQSNDQQQINDQQQQQPPVKIELRIPQLENVDEQKQKINEQKLKLIEEVKTTAGGIEKDFIRSELKKALKKYNEFEYEIVLQLVDRILLLQAYHSESVQLKANALFELGKHRDALQWIDRALLFRRDPELILKKAFILLSENRSIEASKLLDEVKEENALLLRLKSQCFLAIGKPQEAFNSFDQALQLKENYLQAMINKINCLLTLKQFTDLQKLLDLTLQFHPNSTMVLRTKAKLYQSQGLFVQSTELIQKALDFDPRDQTTLSMAVHQLLIAGNLENALQMAQYFVNMHSKSAVSHLTLANCLVSMNNLSEAEISINKALQLDPNVRPYVDQLRKSIQQQSSSNDQQQSTNSNITTNDHTNTTNSGIPSNQKRSFSTLAMTHQQQFINLKFKSISSSSTSMMFNRRFGLFATQSISSTNITMNRRMLHSISMIPNRFQSKLTSIRSMTLIRGLFTAISIFKYFK